MDFQRVLLSAIFVFSIYSLWVAWEKEHQQPVIVMPADNVQSTLPKPDKSLINQTEKISVSNISQSQTETGELIRVQTDTFIADISTVGGNIVHLELLKHFDPDDKSKPFLVFDNTYTHKYIAQTGLLGGDLPNHNSLFKSSANSFKLTNDSDSLEVILSFQSPGGVQTNKIFVFHKNSYLIDVKYVINNKSKSVVTPSAYYQLVRDDSVPGGASMFVPTFTGPATYTSKERFNKIQFSDIEKKKATVPPISDNGWTGMLQHYFVSAWLPSGSISREFYVKQLESKIFATGLILPFSSIASGTTSELTVPLYVGPAHSQLDEIAEGLGLTVDYGFLTVIAKPIFWLLTFIHQYVLNWGIAIIILTILIKLLFFPLSAASYRSMAKMRVVAPKLSKIKEQYGHDRERLNRAMMDLYKTEKINPLGGCLPILIQIPVFIALYWSILSSVEMRYAPFFGWITDLSKADPYYVLPVIMGVSMIIQTKLNPTPPDPLQAKMMQIMPIAFSIIFFFFPAGLVIYSIVNNVLSILQQWYITRMIESETKGVSKV